MVLVYVTDDFTFLDQEFKKGSVMVLPMIQAYAMSESNRSLVTEKAVWLGVDIISFAVGIGEIKVFFTVGNYIRKGIILSDLVGSGAGALATSLNESAISPQLRFKIQMLSIVASVPMLATSFKNINNFIKTTDNEINALHGIDATAKSELGKYFDAVSARLTNAGNSFLVTLNALKPKLGFLPPSPLNFTNFVANTGDSYVDIIVHFQNGKYVISKEGALTTELLIDDLAKIINEVPNGKSVRLLSCNDLEAARQLSQITTKPFYASDGWVDLYANGEVRSQNAFHKFENGTQGSSITHQANEINGISKVRLGKGPGEWLTTLKTDPSFNSILTSLTNGSVSRQFVNVLNIEEEAVLRFYTTNPGYKDLNRALRGEIPMTNLFEAQRGLMDQALRKLPNSSYNNAQNLLYRIENLTPAEINAIYIEGKEITTKAFTSSTYSEQAIIDAIRVRNYTVLIRIEGKNGKLIESLSTLPAEKEILFSTGTVFEVKKVGFSPNPDDYMTPIKTIWLKEK